MQREVTALDAVQKLVLNSSGPFKSELESLTNSLLGLPDDDSNARNCSISTHGTLDGFGDDVAAAAAAHVEGYFGSRMLGSRVSIGRTSHSSTHGSGVIQTSNAEPVQIQRDRTSTSSFTTPLSNSGNISNALPPSGGLNLVNTTLGTSSAPITSAGISSGGIPTRRGSGSAGVKEKEKKDKEKGMKMSHRIANSFGRVSSSGSMTAAVGVDELTRCPIVEIIAVHKNDAVPEGFTKMQYSAGGRDGDLNHGSRGPHTYLCVRRDITWTKPAVIGVTVVFPEKGEYFPPRFNVVGRKGQPLDLNSGTGGSPVFLCYRTGGGNPISDISIVLPRKGESPPSGYVLLEESPSGIEADLNHGTGGSTVMLAYRQQLLNMQALRCRPDSLLPLASVPGAPVPHFISQPNVLGGCHMLSVLEPINNASTASSATVDSTHHSAGLMSSGHPSDSKDKAASASLNANLYNSTGGGSGTPAIAAHDSSTSASGGTGSIWQRVAGGAHHRTSIAHTSISLSSSAAASLARQGRRSLPAQLPPTIPTSHQSTSGITSALPASLLPSPPIEHAHTAPPVLSQSFSTPWTTDPPPLPPSLRQSLSSQDPPSSHGSHGGSPPPHPNTKTGGSSALWKVFGDKTSPPKRVRRSTVSSDGSGLEYENDNNSLTNSMHSLGDSIHSDNSDNAPASGVVDVIEADGEIVSQRLRDLMFLLLTGLYSRKLSVRSYVLQQLMHLLRETDFFAPDLKHVEPPASASPNGVSTSSQQQPLAQRTSVTPGEMTALAAATGTGPPGGLWTTVTLYGHAANRTLLDFTLEAVCDQLDQVSQSHFPLILQFITEVVQKSNGGISYPALQRVCSAYTFLSTYYHSDREATPYQGEGLRDSDINVSRGPIPRATPLTGYHQRLAESAQLSFKELLRLQLARVERQALEAEENALDQVALIPSATLSLDASDTNGDICSGPATSAVPTISVEDRDLLPATSPKISSWDLLTPEIVGVRFSWPQNLMQIPDHASKPVPKPVVVGFVKELVMSVIDSTADMVELAKTTELVVKSIKRHSVSHSREEAYSATTDTAADSSSVFFSEIGQLGISLFGVVNTSPKRHLFALLCALCRMAGRTPQPLPCGEMSSRDMESKVLGLDLLRLFLQGAGSTLVADKVFGYQIRRLVVETVLSNSIYAFSDERPFQLILGIIRMIWRNFRRHCKIELAVMLEHIMLRTLKGERGGVPIPYRVQVLDELLRWFDVPHNLVELFLNYDMDRRFLQQRVIFNEMVASMCTVAEGGKQSLANHITSSNSLSSIEGMNTSSDATLAAAVSHLDRGKEEEEDALRVRALKSVSQIVKSLMDASGHGHLLTRDPRTRMISLKASGGWEDDVDDETDIIPNTLNVEMLLLASNASDTSIHHDHDDASAGARVSGTDLSVECSPPHADNDAPQGRRLRGPSRMLASIPSSNDLWSDATPPENTIVSLPTSTVGSPTLLNNADADSSSSSMRGPRRKRSLTSELLVLPNESTSEPISLKHVGTNGNDSDINNKASSSNGNGNGETVVREKRGGIGLKAKELAVRYNRPNSFRYRRELHKRAEEVVQQALEIYKKKGLKKAVRFLIASNFIADTPRDIANFLRIYQDDLDSTSIGDFLSEPDLDGGDYWHAIRLQYVRAVSFHSMSLEEALRHLLTNSGFRLPGEGQKIDRLLCAFSECYFADNMPTEHGRGCPFSSSETPFVLSYAIIMLNTDLHRANGLDRRKRKRMTKHDFIKNLRGVADVGGGGTDGVTPEYLASIYDSIEASPIEMLLDDAAGGGGGKASSKQESASEQSATSQFEQREMCIREIHKGCTQGGELLRALSMFVHRFLIVGVDTSLSLELVKQMFSASWFHFLGAVNSVLDRQAMDVESVVTCLEIVKYAICTAVFLNMRTECGAFAAQGAKFAHRMNLPEAEEWFKTVEHKPYAQAEETIASVLAQIRTIELTVHETYSAEELHAVARRIKNVNVLDGTRKFVREGDLIKWCRSGKRVSYRFFLFSDMLLYAHCSFGGEWKVHEQLLLSMLRVEDAKDRKGCRFIIHHPKKTFAVSAKSPEARKMWMHDINQAVEECVHERRRSSRLFATSVTTLQTPTTSSNSAGSSPRGSGSTFRPPALVATGSTSLTSSSPKEKEPSKDVPRMPAGLNLGITINTNTLPVSTNTVDQQAPKSPNWFKNKLSPRKKAPGKAEEEGEADKSPTTNIAISSA